MTLTARMFFALLQRGFYQELVEHYSRGVDDDVELAELFYGGSNSPLCCCFMGDIAEKRYDALGGELVYVLTSTDCHDPCAALVQQFGGGFTNSASGTRDDGGFSF